MRVRLMQPDGSMIEAERNVSYAHIESARVIPSLSFVIDKKTPELFEGEEIMWDATDVPIIVKTGR